MLALASKTYSVIVPLVIAGAFQPSMSLCASKIVLLENGNTLSGIVKRQDGNYLVSFSEKGTMTLPRERVKQVFASPIQAYRFFAGQMDQQAPGQHARLADWCLRHKLTAPAADHILRIMELAPRHGSLKGLERRVRQAVGGPATSKPASESETASLNPTIDPQSLSKMAIKQFAQTIQPLVMNRCGATTCHGGATASRLQLLQPNWGNSIPQRITVQNITALLAWIDEHEPSESALLDYAAKAHGKRDTLGVQPITVDQINTLTHWVKNAVTTHRKEASVQPIEIEKSDKTPPPFLFRDWAAQTIVPTRPPVLRRGKVQSETTDNRTSKYSLPTTAPSPVELPVIDSQDPELFNQRFLSDQSKSATKPF